MNKHLPVLITLLTFGSFGVAGDDSENILLKCLKRGFAYPVEGYESEDAVFFLGLMSSSPL